jgi:hypothetical protein
MDLRKKLLELPDGEEKMQAEKMIQMLENDIPFEYGIVEPEQEAKSYWRPEFLGGQPDTKARPAKYGYIAKGPAIPTTIK